MQRSPTPVVLDRPSSPRGQQAPPVVIRTEMHIEADPDAVFAVLADATTYPDWVVGARRLRGIDGAFPDLGAVIHVTVGLLQAELAGTVTPVRVDPPSRLELEARVHWFHVRIRFDINEDATGVTVVMLERGLNPASERAIRFTHTVLRARNAETLWRLRRHVRNRSCVQRHRTSAVAREVPPWLEDVTARLFATAASVRRARALHPRGATHRGRARLSDHGAALAASRDVAAVVRFSRGAGLPDRLPDVNGLAVRLVDAQGRGAHRDFLFSSAGPGFLRRVLVPGIDFGRSRFSSILRFHFHGKPVVLTACVTSRNVTLTGLRFGAGIEIIISAVSAEGTAVLATVTTDDVIDGSAIRFEPHNADLVLQPVGFLNALRAPAYAASRSASEPAPAAEAGRPR